MKIHDSLKKITDTGY